MRWSATLAEARRLLATRHWQRLATTCHLDADVFVAQVRDMAGQLCDAMHGVIGSSSLSRGEQRAANAVLDAIAPWVRACARKLD